MGPGARNSLILLGRVRPESEIYMKVLIIDDDQVKVRKLVVLLTSCGVSREQIEIARSASDARTKLRSTVYEMVILDLLLPHREEDDAQLATSLELLRDLEERDEYKKPKYLVGFTAYPDAAIDASPDFASALWTVVVYDETTNGWEERIRRLTKYLKQAHDTCARRTFEIDLCLISALRDPELNAIHSLPWAWETPEPMDDNTFVTFGSFADSQRTYRVVSACATRMGNVASALLAARLVERYRPRFLVMIGICAGVRHKVNLGDVVLFSPSWEWASGKVVPDKDFGSHLEPAPHQIPVSEFILGRAEELRTDRTLWTGLKNSFPHESEILPKLVIAPGASGPSVLADANYSESLRAQHRKLTAIDMEVYGVVAAAMSASSPRPTAFGLKGVSDFADEEKSDDTRKFAAYMSARTIHAFFERYMRTIYDLAGS